MNEVSIQIFDEQARRRPGETLQGLVTWSATCAPRRVEVRLFWFTTGVAPQQIGLAEKTVFNQPVAQDSRRFAFVLPATPWSFQGQLTVLRWAVEAVLLPSRTCARTIFDCSPHREAILLHRADRDVIFPE